LALYCKGSKKLLSVLGIIFCLFLFPQNKIAPTSLPDIELVTTQIPQEERWNLTFLSENVSQSFRAIESAIDAGKDIVVLPETAFPFVLENSPNILQSLERLSHQIAIVAGSLRQDGNKMYNSSYIFTDGSFQFIDKQLLVPFGETMPLPQGLKDWLNERLGKGEFAKPANFAPMDFEVGEWRFRSAICYEATSEKMFRGNPEFMIAISNNAWFTPSTQPALQELVMLAYAKAHHTIIYHATNGSASAVINPFTLSHF
ncbi:MAG: apolipoprotein N-acyltransferase, partial [Helicobacter sp.]|nr:apolipoprotein N-acyltransferase [Helicobacter sp.]